ncbi:MAG: hypothetical protein JWN40_2005 [Phycisphaerales bacterium]|nr:hypothetical protein [Phycisphaerales bacterium]
MGRLRRILFRAATVLSFLLCIATLLLWVASYQRQGILVRRALGTPHTFAVEAGTISVRRQPTGTNVTDTARLRVSYLHNADLSWTIGRARDGSNVFEPHLTNRSTWANFAARLPSADYEAALLEALDDPSRFAAAHVALANARATPARRATAKSQQPGGPAGETYIDLDGLVLRMPANVLDYDEISRRYTSGQPMPLTIDPTSQARLRRLWNGRLAEPAASLACRWLVLPLLILPGAWGWSYVSRTRRAKLRRQGRCPSCGYDLRATPDRCPECGMKPNADAAR